MYTITYSFQGYQNYEPYRKKLAALCEKAFIEHNPYFMIAINEAVCNAFKYHKLGPREGSVSIQVRLSESDITVIVRADTHAFDMKDFQKRMRALLKNKKTSAMEWGDYTDDTDRSRGFWYMLQAVDYLIAESDCSSVTLSEHIPYSNLPLDTHIEYLVPKLMVRTNGVIA